MMHEINSHSCIWLGSIPTYRSFSQTCEKLINEFLSPHSQHRQKLYNLDTEVGRCIYKHVEELDCYTWNERFVNNYYSYNDHGIVSLVAQGKSKQMVLPFPKRPFQNFFWAALVHPIKVSIEHTGSIAHNTNTPPNAYKSDFVPHSLSGSSWIDPSCNSAAQIGMSFSLTTNATSSDGSQSVLTAAIHSRCNVGLPRAHEQVLVLPGCHVNISGRNTADASSPGFDKLGDAYRCTQPSHERSTAQSATHDVTRVSLTSMLQAFLKTDYKLGLILQSTDVLDCSFANRIDAQLMSARCGEHFLLDPHGSGVLYLGAMTASSTQADMAIACSDMTLRNQTIRGRAIRRDPGMCYNMWESDHANCVSGIYERTAAQALVTWMQGLNASARALFTPCSGMAHLADLGYVTRGSHPNIVATGDAVRQRDRAAKESLQFNVLARQSFSCLKFKDHDLHDNDRKTIRRSVRNSHSEITRASTGWPRQNSIVGCN
eukprot:m.1331905 g.1331905  ORF g.1331905 m.1331905 type:complete len:487 (-) comp24867_c1_seq12:138-1598(-)